MNDQAKFAELACNAADHRPNQALGERNLFRFCSRALEWPIPSAHNPERGRLQLGGAVVRDVTDILGRHLADEDYGAVDVESFGGAMALLARVLDPKRSGDIRRQIREELRA